MLKNYLRQQNTNAFKSNILSRPIMRIETAPASVLLRTIALYALTDSEYRQNDLSDAYKINPPVNNEFLFSQQQRNPFPNRGNSFSELLMAYSELDINAQNADQAYNMIRAIVHNYEEDNNHQSLLEDMTRQTDNFYDSVNNFHNLCLRLSRQSINSVIDNEDQVKKYVQQGENPDWIVKPYTATLKFPSPAITMAVRRNGNIEGVKIHSYGSYAGNKREQDTFRRLQAHFTLDGELDDASSILKDLYRLECTREPAALLTNAMFLELATAIDDDNPSHGYQGVIYDSEIDPFYELDFYSFTNIRNVMPMAPLGATKASRILWKKIINTHADFNLPHDTYNPIYYFYDYHDIDSVEAAKLSAQKFSKMENNLLFEYLIYRNHDLTNHWSGADLNSWGALFSGRIQKRYLRDHNFIGNDDEHIFTYTSEHLTVAITFKDGLGPFSIYDVRITAFSLKLLEDIMNKYYPNINLPQETIRIDLRLFYIKYEKVQFEEDEDQNTE